MQREVYCRLCYDCANRGMGDMLVSKTAEKKSWKKSREVVVVCRE